MSKKPAPDSWEPSATGSDGTNHHYVVSPDGHVRIDYEAWELRKTEFLEAPTVTDLRTGKVLFALPPYFDASESWSSGHDFTLWVREGTDFSTIGVAVDVDAGTLTIERTGEVHPFARAEKAIRRALENYRASLPPPPPPPPGPPKTLLERLPRPASGWKNWFLMLLIAVGFYAVFLGFLFWNQHN